MSEVPSRGVPMLGQGRFAGKLPSSYPHQLSRLRRGQDVPDRIQLRDDPQIKERRGTTNRFESLRLESAGQKTTDQLLVRGVGFEPTKAYATGFLLKPDLKSSTTPDRSGPAPLT
jgi:hypothetical protein